MLSLVLLSLPPDQRRLSVLGTVASQVPAGDSELERREVLALQEVVEI